VDPATIVETTAIVFVEIVLPLSVEKLNDPILRVDAFSEDTSMAIELILLPITDE